MLNRRDAMIRLGQAGLGLLTLPGLLRAEQARAAAGHARPARRRARSCIHLFLWGGPPQQDLWDMKPDAPQGVRSLFKPAATNVPGVQICDQMPRLARVMDRVAVVRSVSHRSDVHEPSVYHVLTGEVDPALIVPRNQRSRSSAPHFGSILSYFSEPGLLPPSITVPRPVGHDGVVYAGTHAGWLGPRYDPLELKAAANTNDQPLYPLALPAGMDATRLQGRYGLVRLLEQQDRLLQRGGSADGYYEQAFRMLSSPAARRAFDLDLEPPAVRDRYGRNDYGESLLLARRLVEAGARLVSVVWMYVFPSGKVSNVWDNHAGYGIHGAQTGYDLLKSPVCIPPLDLGYSALIEDLAERGLLDETLVAAVGEFGRTPKINTTGGRDHWGRCQSALLAGGGVRGGQVYGASDPAAAYVRDNPVAPEDLIATVYHAFGLEPEQEIQDREGRPHRITNGKAVTALFA